MADLQTTADKLWNGEYTTHDPEHHPFSPYAISDEVAGGVVFFKDFVNVTGVRTDDGLVMVDTGSYTPNQHMRCFNGIREHFSDLLHTAIYTHGHVDHAYGLPPYLEEIKTHGANYPRIVGHENVAPRMDRYVETAGYNNIINERQFGVKMHWPTDPIKPNLEYRESLDLTIGDTRFRLFHTRGETDDHTWVFLPDQKVLCTGDLFIWASPNAGNPQKVQRYAIEWARGLRRMASLEPEVLLPGHGVPVYGSDRVNRALTTTASYLESLYDQTLSLLNQGARIYDIIETVKVPGELQELPWLQPIYDEPDFIVRNIVRHLGGWYSGVPSELKPAPRKALAGEVVALAGGLDQLLNRIRSLVDAGNHDVAAHFIDYAIDAAPDSAEVKALRQEIYSHLANEASSTMSKGIYNAAARNA
ncbi:MAG: MBL fold metallo-hydrolase [Pseudomonadales bacterium]|nr:MBL fold metallo-hydrolase [Pseudomonadales bacterium]